MKSTYRTVSSFRIFASLAIFSTLAFTACHKSDDDNQNTPISALMAFNLAPDKSGIGVSLSGNSLTNSPLAYTNFTGGYANIYSGNRTVEAFDQGSSSITNTTYNFEPQKYYSLFVTGINNTYQNIVAPDNFDSLSTANGDAYIRYINAIPDSSKPLVTIAANGSNVVNTNAAFNNVSDFAAVRPGDVSVNIDNNNTIKANRTITVDANKVYTVLLLGVPGAVDTSQAVQIKYVENGTLSTNAGE